MRVRENDVDKLILEKITNNTDKSYKEIYKECFGVDISEDESRKRIYGIKQYMLNRQDVEEIENEETTTILSISDIHFPYQIDLDFLKKYKGKIDVLVFAGDCQDCQSISSFPKLYRNNFMDETLGCRQMMIDIINTIQPKETYVIFGNHEERLATMLMKTADESILELMPKTSLQMIVETGINKYDHRNKKREFYEPLNQIFENITYVDDWFVQIGKTIFAHPKAFRNTTLGTVGKTMDYFVANGYDFDAISIGHTHRLGFAKVNGKYLYEQGCLCKPQDYAKSKLMLPQQNGCFLATQNANGDFIYDKSKLIIL